MGAMELDPARGRPESRPSLFLSYSRSDNAIARRVAHDLRARGVEVWIDEESLAVGKPWADQIRSALTSVDAVLILVSESSLTSEWVQVEWSAALASRSARLLPALVGPIDWKNIPPALADIQFVDLTEDYERGLERIVEALPKLQVSKAPDPAAVIDMDRLVRDVAERVAERLGIEGQPDARPTGAETLVDDALVFVVTSFAEEMEPIFEGISAAAKRVGLRAERVKDVVGDYRITDQVMKMIQSARLIVADLSWERPNVYFELGYARGLGKTVVTIMRLGTKVHFDVKDWTYMTYIDSRLLERDLTKRFEHEVSR
jgi:TIR domain